jgi:cell division protein FtsL
MAADNAFKNWHDRPASENSNARQQRYNTAHARVVNLVRQTKPEKSFYLGVMIVAQAIAIKMESQLNQKSPASQELADLERLVRMPAGDFLRICDSIRSFSLPTPALA